MVYVQYVYSKACGTPQDVVVESYLAQTHVHHMHLHVLCLAGAQITDRHQKSVVKTN